MAINVEFNFNGNKTNIQCSKTHKMEDICKKFTTKMQKDINTLYFLYNGTKLNLSLLLDEVANKNDKERNKMNILVQEQISTSTIESQNKIKRYNLSKMWRKLFN